MTRIMVLRNKKHKRIEFSECYLQEKSWIGPVDQFVPLFGSVRWLQGGSEMRKSIR